MPLELGAWRIDSGLTRMAFAPLDLESRLQNIIASDISVVDPNLMVIGREVKTDFDKRADIVAINRDGNLVILELKRDRTPRDIVAQALEYGAWVRNLRDDDIARIFDEYLQRYHSEHEAVSIDEAFSQCFNVSEMPEELNSSHELVIVASTMDPSTERIVQYLADEYAVNINAVFFRCFKDGDREYLCRAWLREPGEGTDTITPKTPRVTGEWNGEYYVSFGHDLAGRRHWDDARKYGFISGGGGSFYSKTLHMLEPGARIWVNVPSTGYVGVGHVVEGAVRADQFLVTAEGGNGQVPILKAPNNSPRMDDGIDDDEMAEHLVRVEWIKTVPLDQAVKEKGLFGNQNTVARPRTAKWEHTVERLRKRFGITDDS